MAGDSEICLLMKWPAGNTGSVFFAIYLLVSFVLLLNLLIAILSSPDDYRSVFKLRIAIPRRQRTLSRRSIKFYKE